VVAELPGDVDQLLDMIGDIEKRERGGGDASFAEAEVIGAFGGVFGDVARGVFGGQFACRVAVDVWVSS
jgi:hypothetical protein